MTNSNRGRRELTVGTLYKKKWDVFMFEISMMSDLQYHFACGTLSLGVKEIDLCCVLYTRKVSNQVPISS